MGLTSLLIACSGGVPSSGVEEPGATSEPTRVDQPPPPLEGPLRVKLSEPVVLAETAPRTDVLRLACRDGECALVWTDSPGVQFLRHRLDERPGKPRTLLEFGDSMPVCHDLASVGRDRWAAILTRFPNDPELPALFLLDQQGKELARMRMPHPADKASNAVLANAGNRAVVVFDDGETVYAAEIDLGKKRVVGDPHQLSGDVKSTVSQAIWDGKEFWMLWQSWPVHQNPRGYLARWSDPSDVMDLPYRQDAILGCDLGRCLLAGESVNKLTITPIDFAGKTVEQQLIVEEANELGPYGDLTLLPHSHGQLLVARRAWRNDVTLAIVDGSGESLVPPEQIEGLGGHHLAHVEGDLYASAWIQPPDNYEPTDLPSPDGQPLTTLPDYQNLWFVTFELE